MSVPLSKYDIYIECGADFLWSFVVGDNEGNLVDLTGSTISAQLREYANSNDSLNFTVTHNGAGGKITLTMPHEDTNTIPYSMGVYDVFLTLNGTTEKIIYGDVTVYPNVTKPIDGEIIYLLSFASEDDFPLSGMTRRVYLSHQTNKMYRWNGSAYVTVNGKTFWDDIPDKPSTFPPSAHNHDERYYTEAEMDTALSAKEDIANLKALAYKDKADFYDDIDNLPSGYPPSPHNHDDRYYTEGEIDTALSGKSDVGHTHDYDDLTNKPTLGNLADHDTVDYETEVTNKPTLGALAEKDTVDWDTDIDDIPNTFPPSSHTHTTSDITDFPSLGTMSAEDASDYYDKSATDALLQDKADIILSSANGAIASFTDGGAYPVTALFVGIEPVQSGSGDPSPDNIRPISGWSTMHIYREAEYDADADPTVTIDLGGTRYGGTLNVLTGELTVDRKAIVLDENNTWGNYSNRRFVCEDTISDCDENDSVGSRIRCLCNLGKYSDTSGDVGTSFIGKSSKRFVYYPLLTIDTKAKFLTWLESNPLQVVYKLATPLTVQLDASTLETLKGENHIWADTGDVAVEYRADTKLYIERLTKPTEDDMVANTNIASGIYFMVGNSLFLSTASIASGEQIVVGTNCTALSLADALNNLNS